MSFFVKSASYDIPMTQEAGRLYLPWIIGLLVFLLSLVLVYTEAVSNIDLDLLTKALPDISHESLFTFGQALKTISYVVIAMILCVILIVMTLITKSSLLAHHAIIDILQLIGANNKYIARQFQRQVFLAAFKGGIIGIVLAIPVIYFLSWLTGYLGIPEELKGGVGLHVFILLTSLPFVISFLSMIISRITVFRTLVRME